MPNLTLCSSLLFLKIERGEGHHQRMPLPGHRPAGVRRRLLRPVRSGHQRGVVCPLVGAAGADVSGTCRSLCPGTRANPEASRTRTHKLLGREKGLCLSKRTSVYDPGRGPCPLLGGGWPRRSVPRRISGIRLRVRVRSVKPEPLREGGRGPGRSSPRGDASALGGQRSGDRGGAGGRALTWGEIVCGPLAASEVVEVTSPHLLPSPPWSPV